VDFDTTASSPPPPQGRSGANAAPGGGPPAPNGARLADLLRSISSDLSLLVRKQIELAKQEFAATAASKARGAAMMAAAAVLALYVVAFVGLAGAAALDLVLPRWAADLIVGVVFLLLAAIAGLVGRRALAAEGTAPERTKETLKEDAEWAKRQLRR
jgi:uncharacterized membrane protein YqjE